MFKYMLLGIVQGLTEFLPVSSSGHLVILQRLLGLTGNELMVAAVLHLATALALVVFFSKDILPVLKNWKFVKFIAVVTLITGAIAFTGQGVFERLFSSVKITAIALAVTGVVLLLTKRLSAWENKTLNIREAVILGIMQSIAVIPGISRSGITISTMMFRKFDRQRAFRISFLAAIPVMLGAAIYILKGISVSEVSKIGLAGGFTAAFFTGLGALYILKRMVKAGRLHYFGYYCLAVAALTLIFIR